jgi:Tol biopolymer transport system component
MRKQCGTGPDPSRDEAAALYVANTDGTGLHQITAYGQADSHPGGSMRRVPDGTKILLASQDHHLRPHQSGGVAHLYRARPDGTHLTAVSNGPNADFLASWGRPPGT